MFVQRCFPSGVAVCGTMAFFLLPPRHFSRNRWSSWMSDIFTAFCCSCLPCCCLPWSIRQSSICRVMSRSPCCCGCALSSTWCQCWWSSRPGSVGRSLWRSGPGWWSSAPW